MVMHRNTIWRNLVESMYHILGAMSDKYQMSLSDPALEVFSIN
jgi:hypothetical protein